jgi:xanthine dehydrogenase YagS FAD-binding subunit
MKNFEYLRPTRIEDATSLLSQGAMAYGGGTDLLDLMKTGIAKPSRVVNLKALTDEGLRRIEEGNGVLRVGALVTLREIADSPLLKDRCAVLQQAALSAASPQLRNVGTLGGNLCQRPRCSYFRDDDFDCLRKGGDTCFAMDGENRFHAVIGGGPCYIVHPSDLAVALSALQASVIVQKDEDRRSIPIAELFVLPEDDVLREHVLNADEIIVGVEIPTRQLGNRSGYTKFRFRDVWDFAVVSIAVVLDTNGSQIAKGRVAFGGVAPVPGFDEGVSAALSGRFSEAMLDQAAGAVLAGAEPLEKNAYKLPLARNLLRRAVQGLVV